MDEKLTCPHNMYLFFELEFDSFVLEELLVPRWAVELSLVLVDDIPGRYGA